MSRESGSYVDAYLQLKAKYFRVSASLFIAIAPQGVLYSSYLEPWATRRLLPLWLLIAMTPWLVYFAVTFIRVPPPITPGAFRRIMLFITYWYATSIAVLAILAVIRPSPMSLQSPYAKAALWVCALLGWVGVPPLLRCSRALADVEAA